MTENFSPERIFSPEELGEISDWLGGRSLWLGNRDELDARLIATIRHYQRECAVYKERAEMVGKSWKDWQMIGERQQTAIREAIRLLSEAKDRKRVARGVTGEEEDS